MQRLELGKWAPCCRLAAFFLPRAMKTGLWNSSLKLMSTGSQREAREEISGRCWLGALRYRAACRCQGRQAELPPAGGRQREGPWGRTAAAKPKSEGLSGRLAQRRLDSFNKETGELLARGAAMGFRSSFQLREVEFRGHGQEGGLERPRLLGAGLFSLVPCSIPPCSFPTARVSRT